MIIIKKEAHKLLRDENNSLQNFFSFLKDEAGQVENDNLVLDLLNTKVSTENALQLLPFSHAYRDRKRSFVLVTTDLNIDEIPEELSVVPTLEEAEDLIQMDEIERDLGF